jgi:2-oxoglutarate ferredoxin oxidoreductase subunit beta
VDLTYVVYNNGVYGLTKGQASPTLPKGIKTKSMPAPAIVEGINPIALAIGAGYTFVARSYALNVKHLKETLKAAVNHRGSSLVDVLQTCPTYNDINTKEWYAGADRPNKMPRLYPMEERGYDGLVKDPSNSQEVNEKKAQAIVKSFEWGDEIPVGVFFKIDIPTYGDMLAARMPRVKEQPLAHQNLFDRDVSPLFEELM